MLRSLFRLHVAVFAVAVGLTLLSAPTRSSAQTPETLDTNAKIHVTVAGEQDISGDYTVDSSGDISLLYVNQIHVQGLTVEQARVAITNKLTSIYRSPQVVVQLLSPGGIDISVSGAVTTPGPHVMRSDSHLNDVMQLAGPTLDADLASIEITHGRPGQTHSVDDVDYGKFLETQIDSGNPQLRDGDIVFVRRKSEAPIQVVVRGGVLHPGRITLPGKSTAVDAIQQTGGLTPDADRTGVVIQHSGSTTRTPVDYVAALQSPQETGANPILLDGDIVIVKTVDRPNTYTVTGAVVRPGEFEMPVYAVSLADALGKAGGAADHAKLDKVNIVRTDAAGKITKIALDARDPATQKKTVIMPGDNVYIPIGAPHQKLDPLQVLGAAISVIAITRH